MIEKMRRSNFSSGLANVLIVIYLIILLSANTNQAEGKQFRKDTPSRPRRRLTLQGGNVEPISRLKHLVPLLRPKDDLSSSSSSHAIQGSRYREHNPLRMYLSCMGIVLVWVATGTLFYSYCNEWPLAQSFFYAIDAGMSIGFCTDVAETKLVSKAFTIIYILLGASVVGGALALFIQSAVEGVSEPKTKDLQLFLEKDAFQRADLSHTGVLSYPEFRPLISTSISESSDLSEDEMLILWKKFDRLKDGVIHFEEFAGTYRGIQGLVQSIQKKQAKSSRLRLLGLQLKTKIQQAWQLENRIYFCWLFWVMVGILWGIVDQKWDPITATHFSISALATGGLTAPQVSSDGILPAEPSIFCGVFCLIGIPLFALTLAHFAMALVDGHVSAMEDNALSRPMSRDEYEAAKHLTTNDSLVHLSDYIVMQLLRQGKISNKTVHVLRHNFELLDTDRTGALTLEQATSVFPSW
jgi:Ca2+-binding EF-hand superfamily protein